MASETKIMPLKPSEIAEIAIFQILWNRMPHRSFVSGLWLRAFEHTPMQWNCLCHVLPMPEYKYFRFYFGNLVLMTPGEKSLWDQCTPESLIQYSLDIEEKSRGKSIANWQGVRELETELKRLYSKHFPYTHKGIVNYAYNFMEVQRTIGKLNCEFWNDFKK